MKVTTNRIKKKLPIDLIRLLWEWYDKGYKNIELDDYQYFQIIHVGEKYKLKMWQEEPRAMKIKSIPHFEECEVWIINDGNVVTMLFPEEY